MPRLAVSLVEGEGEKGERERKRGGRVLELLGMHFAPFWGVCHHYCCQPRAAKAPGKGILLLLSLPELYVASKTLQYHLTLADPPSEEIKRGRKMKTLGSHTPNQHPPLNILTKPVELTKKKKNYLERMKLLL